MASAALDYTRELFVTGLKNAHALENQALSLMDRQIDHLENYPEVEQMLRQHRAETEQQIQRIDEIRAGFDASPSGLKDAALSFTGNMAAIAHVFAPDEILKNTFANHAFENFEIASYTSLLTLTEMGGFGNAASLLEQSLAEERRMAQLVLESVPMITRKYAELRAVGETAGH
jgi:ferritin-like metal-binding protein YciE